MADNPHYMTPEKMSKLICPFGRGNNMPGKEITVDGSPIGKPCVSILCAAWRWASWDDAETQDWVYSDDYGYCGMVGP